MLQVIPLPEADISGTRAMGTEYSVGYVEYLSTIYPGDPDFGLTNVIAVPTQVYISISVRGFKIKK